MRQLAHGATRHCFCPAAAPKLVEQPDNQGRLDQQCSGNQHDLPAVLLPCGWLFEVSNCTGWKPHFRKLPSPKLSCVPPESKCIARSRSDRTRVLACENLQSEISSRDTRVLA